MQTFEPDALDIKLVTLDGQPIPDLAKPQYLVSVKNIKVAYIRIHPQLRDFLKKVHDNAKVVGFQYDFEEGDLNFGILVKDDETDDDTDNLQESDDVESDETITKSTEE
ncbi:hypothetical protein [Laspinema olomoucense]|uniref:hypothetical protein n=1 Tax=Laspinema olomoucense TaxID=3231600 RepID=UPI0021BA9134|nr:hypothetical protein [Laspinema sp. D3d]MCT7971257.1 hypothetical protein [Laspinema sp. D3d]